MSLPDVSGSPGAVRGWVLYDGQCGVCNAVVPRWARSLRKRGFLVTPLQEPWVSQHLTDLGEDPGEQTNRWGDREDVGGPLLRFLRTSDAEQEELGDRTTGDGSPGMSPEMEDQLRRLGYLDDS